MLRIVEDHHVLRITIERPKKRNAFTQAMYASFREALYQLNQSDHLKALVLSASGPFFSAGNDIGDFVKTTNGAIDLRETLAFLKTLPLISKPFLAAVNGPAIGVGATLLLHADYVIATPEASLTFPFTQLGVCPEAGSSYLLPRRIGSLKAQQYLLFGDAMSAHEAKALGMYSELTENLDTLKAKLDARIDAISRCDLAALKATKALMKDEGALTEAIERECVTFQSLLGSSTTQARLSAFLES